MPENTNQVLRAGDTHCSPLCVYCAPLVGCSGHPEDIQETWQRTCKGHLGDTPEDTQGTLQGMAQPSYAQVVKSQ